MASALCGAHARPPPRNRWELILRQSGICQKRLSITKPVWGRANGHRRSPLLPGTQGSASARRAGRREGRGWDLMSLGSALSWFPGGMFLAAMPSAPGEGREPGTVPFAVGVQIKKDKPQLPLCLQPPWRCSFVFSPLLRRSWRLIFPHGARVERTQSTHGIAALP